MQVWKFLGSALLLSACLSAGMVPAPAQAAKAAGEHQLRLPWPSDMGELNPHLYSPNQMFAQAMLYEPLVKYSRTGEIQPWLAESWEISEDGRSYTFKLREDVTFSNGEPFNAAAVVANFNAVLANRKRHAWLELANQIQQVEALGPHTVRLTLSDPYYPALQELALPRPFRFIAPSQFLDGGTVSGIRSPIGTGPWTLAESRLGEAYLFKRNPNYWGSQPAYESILVKVMPDPNSRAIALETGEIDLVYGMSGPLSPDTFERFKRQGKMTALISEPYETLMLALNTAQGPTADPAVRRAINHAIDKDLMIRTVLHNTQHRADTLLSPQTPYADVGLTPYTHDPALAAQLLEEAGWSLAPGKNVRSRNGEELRVDLVFIGTDAIYKSMAEIIQSDLARIGIASSLIGEEESSVYARQRDGRFSMVFNRSLGAPYDPHAYLSSMRAPSHADFQAQLGLPDKAEIDALIQTVLTSTDPTQRQKLYRTILHRLHEHAVYVPLTYLPAMAVARPGVTGLEFSAISSEIPLERFAPQAD